MGAYAVRDRRVNSVRVGYVVNDVGAAVDFYTHLLGFEVIEQASRSAVLARGDLELQVNTIEGSEGSGRVGRDGPPIEARARNRLQLEVQNLLSLARVLRREGTQFRSQIMVGSRGNRVSVNDPSGNPIELFEPEGAIAARAETDIGW